VKFLGYKVTYGKRMIDSGRKLAIIDQMPIGQLKSFQSAILYFKLFVPNYGIASKLKPQRKRLAPYSFKSDLMSLG